MILTTEDTRFLRAHKIAWPEDPAPVTQPDWVRRATEYEQSLTLARHANQGLSADLDHAALRLESMRKTAERWLGQAEENARAAAKWRSWALVGWGFLVIALIAAVTR